MPKAPPTTRAVAPLPPAAATTRLGAPRMSDHSANRHAAGTNWKYSTTDCIQLGKATGNSSSATAHNFWHEFCNVVIPWVSLEHADENISFCFSK